MSALRRNKTPLSRLVPAVVVALCRSFPRIALHHQRNASVSDNALRFWRVLARLLALIGPLALAPASVALAQSQSPAAPAAPSATAAPTIAAPAAGDPSRVTPILDQARSQLDQIIATLKRDSLDDAALQALRTQLDPISMQTQNVANELGQRADALKARLDQLGPKPDDKAPAENAVVTMDRLEQQKLFNDADEALKRARLLSLQADQTAASILTRRRALFVNTLFQRTSGLLAPSLWGAVIAELPADGRALQIVLGDYFSSSWAHLTGWRLPVFLALLAALGLATIFLTRVAKRILSRDPHIENPQPLQKALVACWIMLVVAITPIAAISVLFAALDIFGMTSARLQPLQQALMGATVYLALTAGLVRGLLAPSRPEWRLVDLDDAGAERISNLVLTIAIIISCIKGVEALQEIIGASVPVTIFTRALGALLIAGTLAHTLYGASSAESDDDDCLPPRIIPAQRFYGPLRLVIWAAIVAILGSVLTGYIAFAAFIVDQIVWISAIIAILFLALLLISASIDSGFKPGAPVGRALVSSLGLRRERLEQLGILLSGSLRIILIAVALLLIAAPWGFQSDDLSGTIRNAFFGFKVGDINVSPSSIFIALVLFALAYGATRAMQGWLEQSYLPATQLDSGLRNSIKTSVGYIGFVLAAALGLGQLGLSFDKLAIVAGALSVGIGFGLQSIVGNFVSGLIILWERAIRVGDWVVMGDEQGYVRRISVRSTEIETFDRATMIVPNSNLVSGVVKNWVRSDKVARIKIPLTTQLGIDPEAVRAIMVGAARAHDLVARIPAPTVLFTSIESPSLKFELLCFVDDVEISGRVKSDLNFEIFKRLTEAEIPIGPTPVPPAVVHVHHAADAAAVAPVQNGEG